MAEYTTQDRILKSDHYKSLYKETAKVILDNSDKALNSVDLTGSDIRLYWGMLIEDVPYAKPTAKLRVVTQTPSSVPGQLIHTLGCKGIMSLLGDDKASKDWECPENYTIKMLAEGILGATLEPFTHCIAYEIVVHQTSYTYENLKPGENFAISLNDNRRDLLQYLLDHTDLFPRVENDDKIHLYKTTPLCYEYYTVSEDDEHVAYSKDSRKSFLTPNAVKVVSTEKDEYGNPKWSGEAKLNITPEVWWFEKLNVASDADAQKAAEAILNNIEMSEKTAAVLVPMNCYAEVYDQVKVNDTREGTTITGHIGYFHKHYRSSRYSKTSSAREVYPMELGFGGWFNARKIRQFIKSYAGEGLEREVTGQYDFLPATFSATLLNQDEAMTFGMPLIPDGGKLYLNAYSLFSQAGTAELRIYAWDGSEWELVWTGEGDTFHKYTGELIYENNSGETQLLKFLVINTQEDPAQFTTGFISYDIRVEA